MRLSLNHCVVDVPVEVITLRVVEESSVIVITVSNTVDVTGALVTSVTGRCRYFLACFAANSAADR